MSDVLLHGAMAAVTSFVGALAGIGGATLLVPLLMFSGLSILEAAPLGLVSVAATSLSASTRQLDAGLVHHRIGVTVEVVASSFAIAGALVSTLVPEVWLARSLGIGALVGAVFTLARRGARNPAEAAFSEDSAGEWPGTLGGTYHFGGRAVPYQAQRVGLGLAVSAAAGAVSGMAGVGGGFLKTPAMSEVMHVPVKVAAATATFTAGVTAASGLLVFAGQGRIDVPAASAVLVGALLGASLGATIQTRLAAGRARVVTGLILLMVALVVIVRTL